jgi:hypothetical protein
MHLLQFPWPDSFYSEVHTALASATALAWGEGGVRQMIDIASSDPDSAATPAILSALTYASINSTGLPYANQLGRDALSSMDKAIRDSDAVRGAAWQGLLSLLGGHSNPSMVGLATQMIRALPKADEKPLQVIVMALSARWLKIGPMVIAELEDLIARHGEEEPRFQAFFEAHPQLLDPLAAHVYPRFDIQGHLTPDFVVRRVDDTYLVVEIETPAKRLMNQNGSLSREAKHAMTQVRDYVHALIGDLVTTRNYFPHFRSPDGLAVVGTEAALNDKLREKLAMENSTFATSRIVGFDWLVSRARALLKNITQDPPVTRARM